MAEFILLMHNDNDTSNREIWGPYLGKLSRAGALRGGSVIGAGVCMRKAGRVPDISHHIIGYVKIEARDFDHARELVQGNPVYEVGGTVEIRELPLSD